MLRSVVAVALLVAATAAWADTIEDKAALCDTCHGLKGVPQYPTAPIIWGQNEGYLYLQLRDFQKGTRKDDSMTPIAQSLTKEDASGARPIFLRQDMAEYQRACAFKADAAAAMTAINSVVCTSCHLEQFQGDSSIPRLAGQEHDYLAKTMMDFRSSHPRQQSRHVGPHSHRDAGAACCDRQLSSGPLRGRARRARRWLWRLSLQKLRRPLMPEVACDVGGGLAAIVLEARGRRRGSMSASVSPRRRRRPLTHHVPPPT